jgi:hypothetical protein
MQQWDRALLRYTFGDIQPPSANEMLRSAIDRFARMHGRQPLGVGIVPEAELEMMVSQALLTIYCTLQQADINYVHGFQGDTPGHSHYTNQLRARLLAWRHGVDSSRFAVQPPSADELMQMAIDRFVRHHRRMPAGFINAPRPQEEEGAPPPPCMIFAS